MFHSRAINESENAPLILASPEGIPYVPQEADNLLKPDNSIFIDPTFNIVANVCLHLNFMLSKGLFQILPES